MTDADLVVAAQNDPAAFAALYERYRDDVLRYCYYCLGHWEEAADTSQHVFLNAFAALPRFIDRDDAFRAWLFRIAHNEVCSRQRQQARRPRSDLAAAATVPDPAPTPEDAAITADEHQRFRQLLTQLPVDRRHVYELRLAGLTDREIATVLDKHPGAIRTAQFRAVARLRVLMGIELPVNRGSHG